MNEPSRSANPPQPAHSPDSPVPIDAGQRDSPTSVPPASAPFTVGQRSDEGSITPLAIGFVVIALLLTFLIAILTDLHMTRRQLQSLADSAALAASDSFEPAPGNEPGLVFSPGAAERAAHAYLSRIPTPSGLHDIELSADADGDHSVSIHLRAVYAPPLLSPVVPGLIKLRATAFARGSLRIS